MGNPVGFKLNAELAGVLGMVSLNAIQIWSTLGIFVGYIFNNIIRGLFVLGILFRFTVPAALIIDMIAFAEKLSCLTTKYTFRSFWVINLRSSLWNPHWAKNAIYAWDPPSFTNAMDVLALQRVLAPLS
ncbi:hypothetical protein RJT34_20445 [Clitoria ternatea]|uniref:Uncharacterized protein n=1 Tax=Clitoria ternatea TaxID=43366 RepID=A0AAN9ISX5_CLITE